MFFAYSYLGFVILAAPLFSGASNEGKSRVTRFKMGQPISQLLLNPTNDHLLCLTFDRMRVIGLEKAIVLHEVRFCSSISMEDIAIRETRNVIVGVGGGRVRFWDLKTYESVAEFRTDKANYHAVDFVSDESVALRERGRTPIFFDISNFQKIRKKGAVPQFGEKAWLSRVSRDGKTMVTAYGFLIDEFKDDAGMIKLWDIETGKLREKIAFESTEYSQLLISPDDRYIVTGDEFGTMRVYDIRAKEIWHPRAANNVITSIAFSRNGRILAYGDEGGSIFLWDMITKKNIAHYTYHQSSVLAITFSKADTSLITGDRDGDVCIFSLEGITLPVHFLGGVRAPKGGGVRALKGGGRPCP